MTEKEIDALLARAADLARRAAGGEVAYGPFLTPQEQRMLKIRLPQKQTPLFCGGYPDAERARAFFLPDYMAELDDDVRREVLAEALGEAVVPLLVKGSGFHTATHRDYLGAVLNLGIKREALGDICVLPDGGAVLFCDSVMATFLKENLVRVARDTVSVGEVTLPPDFNGGRSFKPLCDTVASPRADAVVAALCHLSRERAQALFARELVQMDYEPLEKYDREVPEGAVLSVRGYGKFVIRSLSDKTKKGRYRLIADQYQ
ncbi:MAG: hypothetical protein E7650_03845 [Ruminococcaceae bacterium]|nr:hypothetical protein [Oscillospiraceae bacterium]